MKAHYFLPVSLAFLIGCEPPATKVTRLAQNVYPAKPEDCAIQVLTSPPSDRKFEEIAILDTTAGSDGQDLNSMLPSIKKMACILGADAVIIKNIDTSRPRKPQSGKAYSVAIKYLN